MKPIKWPYFNRDYEPWLTKSITIDTAFVSPKAAVEQILDYKCKLMDNE